MRVEKQRGNKVSNSRDSRHRSDQKKESSAGRVTELGEDGRSLGNDYWDRVANDVASGYKSKEDDDSILNIDQEPGDHEPGDRNPV